ncbi:MAG: hypothetical protein AAF589_01575 [Planctomycetota bacterium]
MVISIHTLRTAALSAAMAIPAVPAFAVDIATIYTQTSKVASVATPTNDDVASLYSRSNDVAYLYGDSAFAGNKVSPTAYDPCSPCPPMPCPPSPCPPAEMSPEPSPADASPAPTPADASPAPTAPADEPATVAPAPTVDAFSADDDFVPTGPFTGGAGAASAAPLALAVAPGYIDLAPVGTRVRVRYDNAQGSNFPTRGEFLYPTIAGLGGEGPPGVGLIADEVDLQEISIYTEFAFRERLSAFVDVPIRWIEPIDFGGLTGFTDGTQQGAGDIKFGVRWALVNEADDHRTVQLRFWTPTGDASRALGVGHSSIDIGYLFDQRVSDNVTIFGEINDWQSIDAGTASGDFGPSLTPVTVDLEANILRYGLGVGVELIDLGDRCDPCRFTGIFEVVGWTVLDGYSTLLNGSPGGGDPDIIEADGDTIINGKYGVRWNGKNQTVYVGYGHNWSSDRWYSDLFRLEWGYNF